MLLVLIWSASQTSKTHNIFITPAYLHAEMYIFRFSGRSFGLDTCDKDCAQSFK